MWQRDRRFRTAVAGCLVVAATTLGTAACGSGTSASVGDGVVGSLPSGVVAQVGSHRISAARLDRAVEQRLVQEHEQTPAPGSDAAATARRTALENLVAEQIYDIEAARCGAPCTVSDGRIAAALQTIEREQHLGSDLKLAEYLQQLKFTPADVRTLIRSQLEERRIVAHLKASARFTDADALAYYRSHQAQYHDPELRQARDILVATEAQADSLRARLTDANFAAMAHRYSIDASSKDQGGDLGTVLPRGVLPQVDQTVTTLRLRQISQPVQTQFGWEIIQVTKITPARILSFAQVRSSIVMAHLAERQQAAINRWFTDVFQRWRKRTVYATRSLLPPPVAPVATGVTVSAPPPVPGR